MVNGKAGEDTAIKIIRTTVNRVFAGESNDDLLPYGGLDMRSSSRMRRMADLKTLIHMGKLQGRGVLAKAQGL